MNVEKVHHVKNYTDLVSKHYINIFLVLLITISYEIMCVDATNRYAHDP